MTVLQSRHPSGTRKKSPANHCSNYFKVPSTLPESNERLIIVDEEVRKLVKIEESEAITKLLVLKVITFLRIHFRAGSRHVFSVNTNNLVLKF